MEGRGYGIYTVLVFWKESERKEQRKKFVKMCVQDGRSVMTISRECVKGILDDALEVFNIVRICLKIYENKFLGMNENGRICEIFKNCCSIEGDKKQIDCLCRFFD